MAKSKNNNKKLNTSKIKCKRLFQVKETQFYLNILDKPGKKHYYRLPPQITNYNNMKNKIYIKSVELPIEFGTNQQQEFQFKDGVSCHITRILNSKNNQIKNVSINRFKYFQCTNEITRAVQRIQLDDLKYSEIKSREMLFKTLYQLKQSQIINLNHSNILDKIKDNYIPLHKKNNWFSILEERIVNDLNSLSLNCVKRQFMNHKLNIKIMIDENSINSLNQDSQNLIEKSFLQINIINTIDYLKSNSIYINLGRLEQIFENGIQFNRLFSNKIAININMNFKQKMLKLMSLLIQSTAFKYFKLFLILINDFNLNKSDIVENYWSLNNLKQVAKFFDLNIFMIEKINDQIKTFCCKNVENENYQLIQINRDINEIQLIVDKKQIINDNPTIVFSEIYKDSLFDDIVDRIQTIYFEQLTLDFKMKFNSIKRVSNIDKKKQLIQNNQSQSIDKIDLLDHAINLTLQNVKIKHQASINKLNYNKFMYTLKKYLSNNFSIEKYQKKEIIAKFFNNDKFQNLFLTNQTKKLSHKNQTVIQNKNSHQVSEQNYVKYNTYIRYLKDIKINRQKIERLNENQNNSATKLTRYLFCSVLIDDIQQFTNKSKQELIVIDQSSSVEERIQNLLFSNESRVRVSSNQKSYQQNVSLTLAIDGNSSLLQSINKYNNTQISNTQFLIDLHILLMKKAQKNDLTQICLMDNSDLQQNYLTFNALENVDKEWADKLKINQGRVIQLFLPRQSSIISPIEKIFKHFKQRFRQYNNVQFLLNKATTDKEYFEIIGLILSKINSDFYRYYQIDLTFWIQKMAKLKSLHNEYKDDSTDLLYDLQNK